MRNTKATDIAKYEDIAKQVISDCRDNKSTYEVFYGKAEYGYFVLVGCAEYIPEHRTMFNVDTKAGARHFANMIGSALRLPVKSDWD